MKIGIGGRELDAMVDTGGAYELLIHPAAVPCRGLDNLMTCSPLMEGRTYGGIKGAPRSGPPLDVGMMHLPLAE